MTGPETGQDGQTVKGKGIGGRLAGQVTGLAVIK